MKTDFGSPKMVECSYCCAVFKEILRKCPRCHTWASENFIVDSWRNYKNKLRRDETDDSLVVEGDSSR